MATTATEVRLYHSHKVLHIFWFH